MTLALIWFAAFAVLELLLYFRPFWPLRRPLAAGLLVAGAGVSGYLFASRPALASTVVVLITLYRVFNLLRVVEGRMIEQYLRRVALRTSFWLILLQVLTLGFWALTERLHVTSYGCWLVLAVLQVIAALGIAIVTRSSLRALRAPNTQTHLADRDLPSISLCIPARNETESLESCLRALIATDYPKLEILVLDDQSHDRTPEIIRSFAHDGVRFINGKEPPAGWLAKNWAYQRLLDEASGDILVFAGVDARFGKSSLRALVTEMLVTSQQMVSILPTNNVRDDDHRTQSVLLQPARYAWELCIPRQPAKRPAVLSTVWAARRDHLVKQGGFAAVMRNITPESYFAKTAAAYSFWKADGSLEFTSSKRFREQWDTAVRTRYPQLHKRPELVLLVSFLQAVSLVFPAGMVVVALLARMWPLAMLAATALIIQCMVYSAIVTITYRSFKLRSVAALPIAILLDIIIRHMSMWRYEFSQVIWKERDVTQPVMHVVPHLPPLE